MEPRQIVGLTGAIVLFVGVFTPIVSIPTVGYINYFQNEGQQKFPKMELVLNETKIQEADHVKYLGLILDTNLTF